MNVRNRRKISISEAFSPSVFSPVYACHALLCKYHIECPCHHSRLKVIQGTGYFTNSEVLPACKLCCDLNSIWAPRFPGWCGIEVSSISFSGRHIPEAWLALNLWLWKGHKLIVKSLSYSVLCMVYQSENSVKDKTGGMSCLLKPSLRSAVIELAHCKCSRRASDRKRWREKEQQEDDADRVREEEERAKRAKTSGTPPCCLQIMLLS